MPSFNKRRIIFVLPALTAGGAERVLITLMNGLDSEKFERSLIAVNDEGPSSALVDPALSLYTLGHRGNILRSLPKLYSRLRALKPDVIVSTMTHMNFSILLLKPFLPGVKIIVREAITPSYFLQRNIFERMIIRMAWRTLYPGADMVVSPARLIIDEFRSLGVSARHFCLLSNPVDVEKIRAGGAAPKRSGVHFMCAGRLSSQKGFDRLIEHLPQMPLAEDWHLTILGEGNQRAALEKLVREKNLTERVTLSGHIENPWPLIAAADTFLMPSRFEGLPNAALESLACGTPVIATRESGGIDEIAAQAPSGSITLAGNMDEFIAAMAKVTAQPGPGLRSSLLPENYERRRVVQNFSMLLEKAMKIE